MSAHRAREMGSIGVGPPNAPVKRPKLRRAGARFLLGAGTEAWARLVLGGHGGVGAGLAGASPSKTRDHAGGSTLHEP